MLCYRMLANIVTVTKSQIREDSIMNIFHSLSSHLHLTSHDASKHKHKNVKKTVLKNSSKDDAWGMSPEDALRVSYTNFK